MVSKSEEKRLGLQRGILRIRNTAPMIVVEEMLEEAVRYGARRAWKHRDDMPDEGVIEQLVEQTVQAFWLALEERGLEIVADGTMPGLTDLSD